MWRRQGGGCAPCEVLSALSADFAMGGWPAGRLPGGRPRARCVALAALLALIAAQVVSGGDDAPREASPRAAANGSSWSWGTGGQPARAPQRRSLGLGAPAERSGGARALLVAPAGGGVGGAGGGSASGEASAGAQWTGAGGALGFGLGRALRSSGGYSFECGCPEETVNGETRGGCDGNGNGEPDATCCTDTSISTLSCGSTDTTCQDSSYQHSNSAYIQYIKHGRVEFLTDIAFSGISHAFRCNPQSFVGVPFGRPAGNVLTTAGTYDSGDDRDGDGEVTYWTPRALDMFVNPAAAEASPNRIINGGEAYRVATVAFLSSSLYKPSNDDKDNEDDDDDLSNYGMADKCADVCLSDPNCRSFMVSSDLSICLISYMNRETIRELNPSSESSWDGVGDFPDSSSVRSFIGADSDASIGDYLYYERNTTAPKVTTFAAASGSLSGHYVTDVQDDDITLEGGTTRWSSFNVDLRFDQVVQAFNRASNHHSGDYANCPCGALWGPYYDEDSDYWYDCRRLDNDQTCNGQVKRVGSAGCLECQIDYDNVTIASTDGFASIRLVSGDVSLATPELSQDEHLEYYNMTIDLQTSVSFGNVTLEIEAGAVNSNAGVLLEEAATLEVIYDAVQPTASFSFPNAGVFSTNESPVELEVVFSEPVNDDSGAFLTLAGSSLSSYTYRAYNRSADGYGERERVATVLLTPAADGTWVNASADAGGLHDAAGNLLTAVGDVAVLYDATAPQVSITSVGDDRGDDFAVADGLIVTNDSPLRFALAFTEDVLNVSTSSLVVGGTGEHSAAAVSGSGDAYELQLSSLAEGTYVVSVDSDAVADDATNAVVSGVSLTVRYDVTPPSVELSSSDATQYNATASDPFEVTAQFSEEVFGLGLSNFSFGGAFSSAELAAVSRTEYTLTISPSGQGAVTVRLNDASVADAAGNANDGDSDEYAIIFDTVDPVINLTTTSASITNDYPIEVTVTASEAIYGLSEADFVVEGATVANLTGAGGDSEYEMLLLATNLATPHDITLRLASGAASDQADNPSEASNTLAVWYDAVRPTVELTSTAAAHTPDTPIPVVVNFSSPVHGFSLSDVSVSPDGCCVLANLQTESSDGVEYAGKAFESRYSLDVEPAGAFEGEITVLIEARNVQDTAENHNFLSNSLVRVYDVTRPTASLSSSEQYNTRAVPIPAEIRFDEPVEGFTLEDLTVSGASAGNFAGEDGCAEIRNCTVFTVDLTPLADDIAVSLRLGANVTQDRATNPSEASSTLSFLYDGTPPVPTVSAAAPGEQGDGYLRSTPVAVTVAWTEAVTGFDSSQVVVARDGAAISADSYLYGWRNVHGAGTQFKFFLSLEDSHPGDNDGPDDGPYEVYVLGADGSIDIAGNPATASASNASFIFDSVAPNATIGTSSSEYTRFAPIPLTLSFSEPVTGFSADNITVANSGGGWRLDNFEGAGASYSVDLWPTTYAGADTDLPGTLVVYLEANATADPALNGVLQTLELVRYYDAVEPTVALTTQVPSPDDLVLPAAQPTVTRLSPLEIQVNFSKGVWGFGEADVSTTNVANVTIVSGGDGDSLFVLEVVPAAEGALSVDIAAAVAEDRWTNPNEAAERALSFRYDTTRPTTELSTNSSNVALPAWVDDDVFYVNYAPILVTSSFSEDVYGLEGADLLLSGVQVANETALDGSAVLFELAPDSEGTLTVSVPAEVCTDEGDNLNRASRTLEFLFDTTRPNATLSSEQPTFFGDDEHQVTVEILFTEDVIDLEVGDLTLVNAEASNFRGNGSSYSVDLSPLGQGLVSLRLGSGVCTDPATNDNLASGVIRFYYDTVNPLLAIVSANVDDNERGSSTNDAPIEIAITYNEPVFGFQLSDVNATASATLSNFQALSADGKRYSFDFAAGEEGAQFIEVPAGQVLDSAGNTNARSSVLEFTFDTTDPTAELTQDPREYYVNYSPVTVDLAASEPVYRMGFGVLNVSGGFPYAISPTANGRAEYAISVEPVEESGYGVPTSVVYATLAEAAFIDEAGNPSEASNTLSFIFDTTRPEAQLATNATCGTYAIDCAPVRYSRHVPFGIQVNFSEVLGNLSAADFAVAGVSYVVDGFEADLSEEGGMAAEISLSPLSEASFTVKLPDGVESDLAGNALQQSNVLSFVYGK